MSESNLKSMGAAAIATVVLAVSTLLGIAIITQMKTNSYIDNTTADNFITGLGVFGTFMGLITLVLVAKIILGLVRGGMGGN